MENPNLSNLSEAQVDAILSVPEEDAFSGICVEFSVELRPAAAGKPPIFATIVRPEKQTSALAPGVLAFHGGGFFHGHPNTLIPVGRILALACNVVTVSVSYRLGTAERPTGPGIFEDAAFAWMWFQRKAGELGVDGKRIGVYGDSAGCLPAGHLAVRSSLVREWMREGEVAAPCAFYANWGPLDFVARWFDNGQQPGAEVNVIGTGGFMARPTEYHRYSVLTHAVGGGLPPGFFCYGTGDRVVHARQGVLGAAAWKAAGAEAELLLLEQIGHTITADSLPDRKRHLCACARFCARHQVVG